VGQWDVAYGECQTRQMTLDTLTKVIEARKQWRGGDKAFDLESDKEDD